MRATLPEATAVPPGGREEYVAKYSSVDRVTADKMRSNIGFRWILWLMQSEDIAWAVCPVVGTCPGCGRLNHKVVMLVDSGNHSTVLALITIRQGQDGLHCRWNPTEKIELGLV